MKFLLTREKENGNILEMKTFWRGENEDPFKGAHANRELIIFISTAQNRCTLSKKVIVVFQFLQ